MNAICCSLNIDSNIDGVLVLLGDGRDISTLHAVITQPPRCKGTSLDMSLNTSLATYFNTSLDEMDKKGVKDKRSTKSEKGVKGQK